MTESIHDIGAIGLDFENGKLWQRWLHEDLIDSVAEGATMGSMSTKPRSHVK